jgi:hypothetical protein
MKMIRMKIGGFLKFSGLDVLNLFARSSSY